MNRQRADFDRFIVMLRTKAMPPAMLFIYRTRNEFGLDSANGYAAGIASCAGTKGLSFLWSFGPMLVGTSELAAFTRGCR